LSTGEGWLVERLAAWQVHVGLKPPRPSTHLRHRRALMKEHMALCENCGKREAFVACLLCRKSFCNSCYDEHAERLSADMDEGFPGLEQVEAADDSLVECEICGVVVESRKKDEHLFEAHGLIG